MRSLYKKLHISILVILMTMSVQVNAAPGNAIVRWWEGTQNFISDTLGWGGRSKAASQADSEIDNLITDPDQLGKNGDDSRAVADGLRASYKADESILKAVGATDYTRKFLEAQRAFHGREEELRQIVSRLMNTKTGHALVIGEAGSGKTSIVRRVALYLLNANPQVPMLENPRFIEIDVNNIVSGTTFRGELEEKVRVLMEYLNQLAEKQPVIVYFDEAHQIMGAGRTSDGSNGVAEQIKPIMTNPRPEGRIHFIFSTTTKEAKHFETDEALQRRLGEPIRLTSPDKDTAIAMIQNSKTSYELEYGVRFSPEAIATFVQSAEKYLPRFVNPDPSLNMMLEAATHALLERVQPAELTRLQAQLTIAKGQLSGLANNTTAVAVRRSNQLRREIGSLENQIAQFQATRTTSAGDIALYNQLRKAGSEISAMKKRLAEMKETLGENVSTTELNDFIGRNANDDLNKAIDELEYQLEQAKAAQLALLAQAPEIGVDEALAAVARYTGRNVDVIRRDIPAINRMLQTQLPRTVPGQARALNRMGQAMAPGLAGLNPKRPSAVITVVDSTDQLKEVAEQMDTLVFGARNAARETEMKTWVLDLSRNQINWVQVAEGLARRPQRVIAFANVEHADVTVQQQLEEIARTGKLNIGTGTDARMLRFNDSVLLFHFGSFPDNVNLPLDNEHAQHNFLSVFNSMEGNEAIRPFTEAILQSSDTVAHLAMPSDKDLGLILRRRLKDIDASLKETLRVSNPVELKISRRAARALAERAGSIHNIDGVLRRDVLQPLHQYLSNGSIQGGEIIAIHWDGNNIVFNVTR